MPSPSMSRPSHWFTKRSSLEYLNQLMCSIHASQDGTSSGLVKKPPKSRKGRMKAGPIAVAIVTLGARQDMKYPEIPTN